MRITVKYDGGPYDGEVSFLDDAEVESLTEAQSLAAEHYSITTKGLVGQWFATGSVTDKSSGAPKYRYEVVDRKEENEEIAVRLKLVGLLG